MVESYAHDDLGLALPGGFHRQRSPFLPVRPVRCGAGAARSAAAAMRTATHVVRWPAGITELTGDAQLSGRVDRTSGPVSAARPRSVERLVRRQKRHSSGVVVGSSVSSNPGKE